MTLAGEAPRTRRWALALVWLALLALGAWAAAARLQVSGDLRAFMPAPRDADQHLLMALLGDGPGSRVLLVALARGPDEDAATLAERSRELRDALREQPEFVFVGNGDDAVDDLPETLLDYRYLVSPGPAEGSLQPAALATALRERLRDLASPAAALVAPLIARDPTLETLRVVQAWAPTVEPVLQEGVWMTRAGEHALLLLQTRAAGFDPVGQQQALRQIRAAYAALEDAPRGGLEVSGPGAFAERMAEQTRAEASRFGTLATLGLIALLLLAYRGVDRALLSALPLASGAVAGLAAVGALFEQVHGITLAFGFTLLGVAQDYPVHLFSHARPREPLLATARHIWPTLAAGTGSACLAYTVFLFAGVDGLRQLAVFTIAGLAVASLATRYLLPRVAAAPRRDAGELGWTRALQRALLTRRWPRWPLLLFLAACLPALWLPATAWWQDDLASLTPVPGPLVQRDRALRAELGAPDVRWLLVLRGSSPEQVLQAGEAAIPALDEAVRDGALSGYDLAARYLPSARTQLARQQTLPAPAPLRAALQEAQAGLAFGAAAFEPFLADVERARTLPPLTPDALAGTPLELRVGGLLRDSGEEHVGLVTLNGVERPETLAALAARLSGAQLLDLKQTAQGLAGAWRSRLLAAMAVAALLLCLGIAWSVRSVRRAARVLAPVALGTLGVVALLHAAGVPLTLFHLVSLVLAACLGVDYALFLERAGDEPEAQRRTLHALAVCSISTLLVFALLGLSQTPVLRAIGLTVSAGVLLQILLSMLITARPSAPVTPASGTP